MPYLEVSPGTRLHYLVDDFTDPWSEPETVLLVHGLAESSEAWRCWVPHLARRWRVLRIDQRGFGQSTPMSEDFAWRLDVLSEDLVRIIEQLSPRGVHLVAAKIAGPVAIRTARHRPDLVATLSLIGTPVTGPSQPEWLEQVEREGVRAWAAATMDARLAGMSQAAKDWWTELMAKTPRSTMLGFLRFVSSIDVRGDLPGIRCPALVVSSDSPRRPLTSVSAWQETLPRSRLVTIPGPGYHAAATEADRCAEAVGAFLATAGRDNSA